MQQKGEEGVVIALAQEEQVATCPQGKKIISLGRS